MPLVPVTFAPGINTETTPYGVGNGFVDSNLVRFRNGKPETMGGWSQINTNPLFGVCRSLLEWSTLAGSIIVAIGTNQKVYALNNNVFHDITPQLPTVALPVDPFLTQYDYSLLNIHWPSHGSAAGNFILISGADTPCGNYAASQLNIQFKVQSVIDADNIVVYGTRYAGDPGQVGGGASVSVTPDLPIGLPDASTSTADPLTTVVSHPRIWHMDNFGQSLVINPRGGKIYIWDANFSNRATLLSSGVGAADVPMYANGIFNSVIGQNIVALGCSPYGQTQADPCYIRWSDILNPYLWTPLSSNSAGGYRLMSGSYIIGWLPTYFESLIWTDTTLYTMQFNANSVYGFQILAKGVSMISPQAAVTNGSTVFWMDRGCFMMYSGSVAELPCSIKTSVFGNINYDQAWKIVAGQNHIFSEVVWFYPSKNSTENDSYAIYNYKDNVWYKGMLARTAWSNSGSRPHPLAIDPQGVLYFHETDTDANGAPMNASIQTGDIDLQNGDVYSLMQRIIPDVVWTGKGPYQGMQVDVLTRNTSSDPYTTARSLNIVPYPTNNGYLDARVRARRMALKFWSNKVGTGWRLGKPEALITADGKR